MHFLAIFVNNFSWGRKAPKMRTSSIFPMPSTEERPPPLIHRPHRHPDAHEVVLSASPDSIREAITGRGVSHIRELLFGLNILLSPQQWTFADLRFNLHGGGFHTLAEIREQMGIDDFTVHCLLREIHTHLLVLLADHREGNGQAESSIAPQQSTWMHALAAASPN